MYPGVKYVIAQTPSLAAPPLLVVLVRSVLARYYGIQVSGRTSASIIVFSYVAISIVKTLVNSLKERKERRELGAVTIPKVKTALPGGMDALVQANQFRKKGYIGERFGDLIAKKYGHTVIFTAFFQDRIFTAEPDYIKLILATDFNNYEKGPTQKFQFQDVLGDGVFNADGDMWKFHRSMTRPFFSRDRISHFDMFGRHADDAINQMTERLRAGYPIDFQDLVSRFTLDSATEFLFGHCVHSLAAGLPYSLNSTVKAPPPSYDPEVEGRKPANEFATSFSAAQDIISKRGIWGNNWPLVEFFGLRTKGKMEIITKFVEPIIKEAIEKKRASVPKDKALKAEEVIDDDVTLLDHLAQTTEDIKVLKDETLNIMIAGRDTTAGLLTFVTYLLSQHPEVLKRLRAEILAHVGPTRHPTPEDLRDMKYLRAVLNETLRLFPSVPMNVRRSRNATTWPSKVPGGKPFYVPAESRIIYSVLLMHRRADLWGPDAHLFDPDRFLDERVQKYITPNPFIFLPFNAGPRICLGQQFAYNEASYFVIRLLQRYSSVDMAPDAQPPETIPPKEWAEAEEGSRKRLEKFWPDGHLTMFSKGGLWLRLGEATDTETV